VVSNKKGGFMDTFQKYFKTKKAAEYLGITEAEIRRYARDGKITYSRPGGKVMLFDKFDLDAFIENNRGK